MAVEEMAMADTDTVSAPRTAKMQAGGDDSAENTIGSSTTDVSTTNLQVDGVDEADIIKTDGDYIYYYNDHLKTITILQSPLDRDTATIRLADATIVSEIKVPKTFWGTQLYVQDGQLILLAQRWSQQNQQSWLDRNGRTNVVIYDITNISDPKLMKLSDFDGSYHDSRRIGDTLYVVSQLNVNRRRPQQYRETAEEVVIDAVDVLPKTIDIAYTRDTDDQNLTIGTTTFPYHVSVSRPDCNEVNYVLPSKESMEEFTIHPSFTVVRAIDLRDTTQEPTTTASFGSTQTIHMSQQ